MILAPLQKLRNNVGDLGKIILTTIFKWLPKVQKIAQSGHTDIRAQHGVRLLYTTDPTLVTIPSRPAIFSIHFSCLQA